MPTLAQSLEGQDLGHCQIIAEGWGIELNVKDTREAIQQLSEQMPQHFPGQWSDLPPDMQQAFKSMAAQGGRLRWTQFTRIYGNVREMGPGRRDKELPHLHPVSLAEKMWYRGMVGRAFLDTIEGLQEFAFIPDDLLATLPDPKNGVNASYGRPARPEERAVEILASDRILDEATTLLAGLRVGLNKSKIAAAEDWRMPPAALQALLTAAGILDHGGKPIPEAVRHFLETGRGEALTLLASTWLRSKEHNDLRLLPGLHIEGGWENDPLAAREKAIAFSRSAPATQWWSISALVADVKAMNPDFQRPAGDYDSWYLRDAATGEYLRGFQSWDAVDGALIAYLIRGPLHWLGFVDLATPATEKEPTAFRWSRWADTLTSGQSPVGLKVEGSRLKVDSRGGVFVPPMVPRTVRYVLARFTDSLPKQKDAYHYQITTDALERAHKQGLEARQFIGLLKTYSSSSLPPNLLQAVKRWEQQGTQARVEAMQVLRINSAGALKALRASKAGRYLGDPLGPTSIAIKPGAEQQVMQALLELGYLGTLHEQ